MHRVLVNGVNSKVAGGRSILTNYIKLLNRTSHHARYFVLTPDASEYTQYATADVEIVDVSATLKRTEFIPFLYMHTLPAMVKRYRITTILNLADIVIRTEVPQVYLFDWPYAVYPETPVWERMSFPTRLSYETKLFFFRRLLRHATIVAAQSEAMRARLERLYLLKNVRVIPNAVSLDSMETKETRNFNLPSDKLKFLTLSHYYVHKNLEILVPLAQLIRSQSLPFIIVTTLAENHHPNARKFLRQIISEKLNDIVVNVGPVEMRHIPSLYKQTNALLLPTLLESFSGTYVEAMFHRRPILTSHFDFATDVCGTAALYFNPLNPANILSAMVELSSSPQLVERLIADGARRLVHFSTWEQTFSLLNQAVFDAADRRRDNKT